MPFGVIGRTGPTMRQVVGFGDRSTGMGTFGCEFVARHCNQWRLTFAATRASCRITFGRLVVIIIIIKIIIIDDLYEDVDGSNVRTDDFMVFHFGDVGTVGSSSTSC